MEKEENWEWIGKVTEMVKQLELSLYESAPSFQAYADKKALKQRLQSCTMEFANRDSRQQLSGAEMALTGYSRTFSLLPWQPVAS